MKWLKAFTEGVLEFRLSSTKHYDDPVLVDAYDKGRDLAHRITLRRYEQ